MVHGSGPQPGLVVVLEQLPATQRFDKEARETLLDVFRDAADFWAERGVALQGLLFFSVTRTPGREEMRGGNCFWNPRWSRRGLHSLEEPGAIGGLSVVFLE